MTLEKGSSFGWQRLTLAQAAGIAAAPALSQQALSPASAHSLESLCHRVVRELADDNALGRFQAVAHLPGLSRSLAQTLVELRLAGVTSEALSPVDEALARILAAYEKGLESTGFADRAHVLRLAVDALQQTVDNLGDVPTLIFDVPVRAGWEERFVGALARRAPETLAIVPTGDEQSLTALASGLQTQPQALADSTGEPLQRTQSRLFSSSNEPAISPGDAVVFASAASEPRECVEIARRLTAHAKAGVAFDQMAVLLRSPGVYRAGLEDALRRAGIPAWFVGGAVRPDRAGRAFVTLLRCAADGISAQKFGEYLSLDQVPHLDQTPVATPRLFVSRDEELFPQTTTSANEEAPDEAPAFASPRHWERLIADARVIGGADRWARRLGRWKVELEREQLEFERSSEVVSERFKRDLEALDSLERFAIPVVDALAALPREATWGEWLAHLRSLAVLAIRHPERVLLVLSELDPMSTVGPVTLGDVRLLLSERLGQLSMPPEERRDGCVFVGPIDAARGLVFDVVCVPGLAEKAFPRRIIEDPLLRDEARERIDANLQTNASRAESERLLLRLAAGAARKALVLSYPRLDAQQARPRVPSFYGLELIHAAEGRLPGYDEIVQRAGEEDPTRLGWPAPYDPAVAIDATEHDIALLDDLTRKPMSEVTGQARYLLQANPHLARALRFRARRALRRWTPADGLVDPGPEGMQALAAEHFTARAYSPTALQLYASCPYRFLLSAIHRLRPREQPKRVEDLDPMQYGSFVHEVQFDLLTRLRDDGLLPLTQDRMDAARLRMNEVLTAVAARYADEFSPTVERVWRDTVHHVRTDLGEWLRLMSEETEWTPWRFELSFGLGSRTGRDEHSQDDPVHLDGHLSLRGSIDLVERRADGALRATDHKTGKKRTSSRSIIGGGETLQPVMYALALEQMFPGTPVASGRLDYCTSNGQFSSVEIALNDAARESMALVSKTIGDALTTGFLPAAPVDDRTCEWCDYLPVCGPGEARRVARKPKDRLEPLVTLRRRP